MPLPHPLSLPLPSTAAVVEDRVVDLGARRAAAEAAVRAAADAPVRHLPAAFLDALHGSWGTPEELLGVRTPPESARLSVAR